MILLIMLSLVDCKRRVRTKDEATQSSGSSSNRNSNRNSSRSRRTVMPKEPEIKPQPKIDTVYIVVPAQPAVPVVPAKPEARQDEHDLLVINSNKQLKPVVHGDNLPNPPTIDFKKPEIRHTRDEYIKSHNIVGDMKDLIIACDYDHPTVRNNTVNLVHLSPGKFNLGQICDIFDFCYSNWSYVNDPLTRDYYSKASETLKNGLNGDCDDFAILLCSMILSIGGEARINFAYDATSGHAFTEVNIGTTSSSEVQRYLSARYNNAETWHRKDSQGNIWLNMDWQATYPGGEYWEYSSGTSFNIIQNICGSL